MAISLSVVLLLGIAVWALYRYDNLRVWHGIICILFGFYLAYTTAAPEIRHLLSNIVAALSGH